MPQVIFSDLGLIDYKAAWDLQEKLHAEIVAAKLAHRITDTEKSVAALPGQFPDSSHYSLLPTPNYLLFCEHPHVYTLGRSGDEKNLLVDDEALKSLDATFYKNNRGGDITYHGPGQIVGYPILNLDNFFTDIHRYLRTLEEAVILTLAEYGIEAGRLEGLTGVWLDPENKMKARKICALGVRCSRWVTMHGFAFNVNTNLDYFGNIVPCGIQDKAVTSMEKELGRKTDIEEVKAKLKGHLADLFEMTLVLEEDAGR
jgi:lipoyl(octanoyl) transferase